MERAIIIRLGSGIIGIARRSHGDGALTIAGHPGADGALAAASVGAAALADLAFGDADRPFHAGEVLASATAVLIMTGDLIAADLPIAMVSEGTEAAGDMVVSPIPAATSIITLPVIPGRRERARHTILGPVNSRQVSSPTCKVLPAAHGGPPLQAWRTITSSRPNPPTSVAAAMSSLAATGLTDLIPAA